MNSMNLSPPTRFPHREGRCYTRLGFCKLLKNLSKEQHFTPQQLRNLKALYFGTGLQEYLDEEGIYRRSKGLWRLGRKLHYAYRVSDVFKLVKRSGIFWCYYNKEGEMMAFKSNATWRLMGSQTVIDSPPLPPNLITK